MEIKQLTTAGKKSQDVNALKKLTFCQPVYDHELNEPVRVSGPYGAPMMEKKEVDLVVPLNKL